MKNEWYKTVIIVAICGILAGVFSCGPFPSSPPGSTPAPPNPPITPVPTASGEWWDLRWRCRKELTISDPLPDYQMEIMVYRNHGFDNAANGTIDCEGRCNSDFSDLRFLHSNNKTKYDYFIGEIIQNVRCRVWIKTTGEDMIYMYYGNSNVKDKSNGTNTFPDYFDHWTANHIDQFQYCTGTNNKHQWAYELNEFTEEKKFVTEGNLIYYIYGKYDQTFIGFTESLSVAFFDSDNYIALLWEHIAKDVETEYEVLVYIQTRTNGGSRYDTQNQSLGPIPKNKDTLKIEIIYTSQEVSYIITNVTTGGLLVQDSLTDPAEIPDMAVAKYFFVSAYDFEGGIFKYRFPSTIIWGNDYHNGGMEFHSDYWFITSYTDGIKPQWSSFSDELSI